MQVALLRETIADEQRVALIPESVKKLIAQKATVVVEAGAGLRAGFGDSEYTAAGATIETDRKAILKDTDLLAAVNRPEADVVASLKAGALVIGFVRPLDEPAGLQPLVERKLTVFSMELIPRTTRAQAMDALSSMATVAGYKAVLVAADMLPRMFPLLMTAAGTVAPARVLVLGAGVAGLQAIATARRLGAMVEAYDVRAAAGEQVKSLGGTFLEVDLGGIQTEDAGGYAKELSEEALNRGKDLIAKHAKTADVIITTAQVPGRKAPRLLTAEAVQGMKRGSVVIDLAGTTGGNCALTKPGETIVAGPATIAAPLNLAATVPYHASQLYSRNVTALVLLMLKDGKLTVDMADDIIGPSCVAHEGAITNPRVASLLSPGTR
jgi:NAD(P) transhydrogenase subunit alpha